MHASKSAVIAKFCRDVSSAKHRLAPRSATRDAAAACRHLISTLTSTDRDWPSARSTPCFAPASHVACMVVLKACADLHVAMIGCTHQLDSTLPRARRRTSFFGGSVSTRKEAAAPGWKAKPRATGGGVSPSTRHQQPAVFQGRQLGQPGLKRARDEQQEDCASNADAKAESKRKRLAYARDYGALQACCGPLLLKECNCPLEVKVTCPGAGFHRRKTVAMERS